MNNIQTPNGFITKKGEVINTSKTMKTLNNLKSGVNTLKEKFNKAKVVDIEDSKMFQNDNSFEEQHEKDMKFIDNLNEDEIRDPYTEKCDYYNGDYWSLNGFSQRVGDKEFLYDYDNKNNEIILKYYTKDNSSFVSYVEDLYEVDKENIKQALFYGEKAEYETGKFQILKTENDFNKFLSDVDGDTSNFIFNNEEYGIRWDLVEYSLDDGNDIVKLEGPKEVYDYFKVKSCDYKLANGYTKLETIDFLLSHPEVEHVLMDIEDKGYRDIYDMPNDKLCNFAEAYGIEDGEDEEAKEYYMLDRNGMKHPGNGQSGYCGKCGKELPNPEYSSNCHNCNTKLI